MQGGPPPIIFERLKLSQQIIYRRKENLSESPNHKNIGKIFWFRDFMSNFREIGGIKAIFRSSKKFQTLRTQTYYISF